MGAPVTQVAGVIFYNNQWHIYTDTKSLHLWLSLPINNNGHSLQCLMMCFPAYGSEP